MAQPTDAQIDEQHNRAMEAVDSGQSKWPGMTYEQGVDNTIRWMRGESDQAPMEDE